MQHTCVLPSSAIKRLDDNGAVLVGLDSKGHEATEHGKVTGWVYETVPVHRGRATMYQATMFRCTACGETVTAQHRCGGSK